MRKATPRIGIVSCVWKRPEKLFKTLVMLGDQTDLNFELFLINNNATLVEFVDDLVLGPEINYPVHVHHLDNSLGPAARAMIMHEHAHDFPFFMTVDDDAVFGPTLVEAWKSVADPNTLMGWTGFRFIPGQPYWNRKQIGQFGWAHYLWGSNLFVPARTVQNPKVLEIDPEFIHCDDLFLCHHAARVERMDVRVGPKVALEIEVDGLDTYHSQHETKVLFLNKLRASGWNV